MVEWNVYLYDTNKKKIIRYDIFSHQSFLKDIQHILKHYSEDKSQFIQSVTNTARYYFWSKTEYEVWITDWLSIDDETKGVKIDIYHQLMMNRDAFINYLLEKKDIILKG